jgi:hypothetical protein
VSPDDAERDLRTGGRALNTGEDGNGPIDSYGLRELPWLALDCVVAAGLWLAESMLPRDHWRRVERRQRRAERRHHCAGCTAQDYQAFSDAPGYRSLGHPEP